MQRVGFEHAKVQRRTILHPRLSHLAILPFHNGGVSFNRKIIFQDFNEFQREIHVFWLQTPEKQFLHFFIKTSKTQNFPGQFFQKSFDNSKLVKLLLKSAGIMEPLAFSVNFQFPRERRNFKILQKFVESYIYIESTKG